MVKWRVCLVVAALLVPGSLLAQTTDAERRVARELGMQGIDAFERGAYPEAVDRLERAYGTLKVPTLGLWSARALARVGKLVEASERYEEVIRMPLEADAPPQFSEAKVSAVEELETLEPRLPSITIELTAPEGSAPAVTLDGATLKATMVGLPIPINPGTHEIEARVGERNAKASAELVEGESKTVALVLAGPNATPAAEVGQAPLASPNKSGAVTSPAILDRRAGSERRAASWLTIGVGGVGVVTGTITGAIVLGKKKDLDSDGCVDHGCPTRLDGDRESYNTLRHVSTAAFVVGGVGLAAGVGLLLSAPHERSAWRLLVSPGAAGVEGSF